MKVTDTELAAFYNVTRQTLNDHKKSDDVRMNNRYKALKEFYIKNHSEPDAAIKELAFKLGECLELINNLDLGQGN